MECSTLFGITKVNIVCQSEDGKLCLVIAVSSEIICHWFSNYDKGFEVTALILQELLIPLTWFAGTVQAMTLAHCDRRPLVAKRLFRSAKGGLSVGWPPSRLRSRKPFA